MLPTASGSNIGLDLLINPKRRLSSDALSSLSSSPPASLSGKRTPDRLATPPPMGGGPGSVSSVSSKATTIRSAGKSVDDEGCMTDSSLTDRTSDLDKHSDVRSHRSSIISDRDRRASTSQHSHHSRQKQQRFPRSVDDAASSVYSEVVRGRADARSQRTEQQELDEKREMLYQFDRLEKRGCVLPRKFTISSSIEEMRAELERLRIDKEMEGSLKFQRKLLMTCVTGIEFLNSKFDPFDVRLDGWSDSIHDNLPEYDDVFEELHMKYRSKAQMAPEIKLMFMLVGSGVMFHMTNSMFRPPPARSGTTARSSSGTGGGGGGGGFMGGLGGLGGLMGSLFGGGLSSSAASPPPAQPRTAYTAPTASPQQQSSMPMRGPVLDDILRELQHNAFATEQRIEVMSNADSDDNISEIAMAAASVGGVEDVIAPQQPPISPPMVTILQEHVEPAPRQAKTSSGRGRGGGGRRGGATAGRTVLSIP